MELQQASEEPMLRPFRPEDIHACTRLTWEAWAIWPGEPEDQVNPRVMEGYVRSFLVRSNWREVAYDSHGVIALLFGRIGKAEHGPLTSELTMIPEFLFRRYGRPLSPVVLLHFLSTEFKVLLNMPKSDAEVNLFIVASTHRGKGLGTRMMNRFMDSAKKAGCKLVTLYTDDQVSNWSYYERRGFRRVATFRDGLTSYFTEKESKGIVYSLALK